MNCRNAGGKCIEAIHTLKMIIKIIIETDNGILLEKAECGNFESAEESLGKIQRHFQNNIENEIDDILMEHEEHDCHKSEEDSCEICDKEDNLIN